MLEESIEHISMMELACSIFPFANQAYIEVDGCLGDRTGQTSRRRRKQG